MFRKALKCADNLATFMEIAERIGREGIPRLLRQVEKDKSVLKMRLLGKDYERLTIITGVQPDGAPSSFLIDYPKGFRDAVHGIDPWRFFFEFSGKDGVFHVFRTKGGQFSEGGEIQIHLPAVIERMQRRKDFRIPATASVKIFLSGSYSSRRVVVLNISAGGALFSLGGEKERGAALSAGQVLKGISVEFQSEELWLKAQVREAVVKRSTVDGGGKTFRYALQFTDVEVNERAALKELIYALQREHLRKRREGETESGP